MRALVIDDSRSARLVLKGILEKNSIDVLEAEDGLQALEILRTDASFDLAMVDWNMPFLNGLDFVKKVRENGCFDALKMIMVTTETEVKSIDQALTAGAGDYILKPYSEGAVVQAVKIAGL